MNSAHENSERWRPSASIEEVVCTSTDARGLRCHPLGVCACQPS